VAVVDGAHYDELTADMARAVSDLCAMLDADPALWARARPGKWTGGQHAEHVAISLELFASLFDDSSRQLAAGTLPAVPGRGPLQSLFQLLVVRRGWMPRGGAAVPAALPGASPNREVVLRRLRSAPDRYRGLGAGLDAARDRLWIRNPFMTRLRWHYALPEAARIQTVHVRHHAAQIAELKHS